MDSRSYENANQIIKRVSAKTLNMKTNHVKLFNKITYEMNNLLAKAQDIIRICLSDRNGRIYKYSLL